MLQTQTEGARELRLSTIFFPVLAPILAAVLAAVLVCAALALMPAQAQQQFPQTPQQDGKNRDRLSADKILYEGTPRRFRAHGEVRMQIHRDSGQILILTDRLDYDGTKGILSAQGGSFGKGRNRQTQGALRLASGDVIFFQRLETDDSLQPLKGEGLGWRNAGGRGGFSAASFLRREHNENKKQDKKEHGQDNWIFRDVRYTRCSICADELAKQEKKPKQTQGQREANIEKTTKKPRTFPPLWRIDAARMRWERFEDKTQGWFDDVPRLHLRHPRLSLYGVPVFYAPYLSFPYKGARASGLLVPEYGQNSQRGWYTALPLYWSPHRGWDTTYVPVFTTRNRDASRFETRTAWSAGKTSGEDKKSSKQDANATSTATSTKKEAGEKPIAHLFDITAGWSLPHKPIGSGSDAQFFAYGKARWQAPWGLRADALYHGLGDRRYLYNYGQGASLFSTSAPSRLTDHARIEHFSARGYARLTLVEQRELLDKPRADVTLLPELVYNNGGVFARSRLGGGSWKVEGLWRRAEQDAQQAIGTNTNIDTNIQEQEAFRQDTVSAAVSLGWRQNLPLSFVSQSTLKLATTYRFDSQEGEGIVLFPEFQQNLEGLFAKSFKKNKRTLYLRPQLEFYATLDDEPSALLDTFVDKFGGKATFYETGARLGDRLAFGSTLDRGQRLLVAAELGVRGARQSSLSMFAAPTLLRQKGEDLSGRLWTGARANWRDRLFFAYDTTWLLAQTRQISQRVQAEAKGEPVALSLAYKEFRALDSPLLYEQDITVKGRLRLRQGWHTDLSAGYGFLGHSVPIGFSLTYKGDCVTLKVSYDRTIYSDGDDSDSFNASISFDFS